MNLSKLPTMLLLGLSFVSVTIQRESQHRLKQRAILESRLEQLGSMGNSLLQALDKVSSLTYWGAMSLVALSLVVSAALVLSLSGDLQTLPLVLMVSGVGSTLVSFFVFGRRQDAHQAHIQGLVDSMVRVPR